MDDVERTEFLRSLGVAFNKAVKYAVAEEREACAKLAELDSMKDWRGGSTGSAGGTAINIAAAIRARSKE